MKSKISPFKLLAVLSSALYVVMVDGTVISPLVQSTVFFLELEHFLQSFPNKLHSQLRQILHGHFHIDVDFPATFCSSFSFLLILVPHCLMLTTSISLFIFVTGKDSRRP